MIQEIGGSTQTRELSRTNGDNFDRDQFVQLLVKEIQHQDPLDPMDSTKILDQTNSMFSIQAMESLIDSLESFQKLIGMSSSAGLIGKEVRAVNADGETVTGRVESVSIAGNKTSLRLDSGQIVDVDTVTEIGS